MQIILSDHNCEGHAERIFDVLRYQSDWLELVPMQLKWFRDFNLPHTSSDRVVWQFCQKHGYLLLTGNRDTKDGHVSLEHQIQHLATADCLPVLTIGNLRRVLADVDYRRRCAVRLADIVADLNAYRGATRLFLT